MNRLTIAAAIAAGACAISIPAAALASSHAASHHGSAHSRIVEDRSGPNRGSDDMTRSVTSTSRGIEPGDDRGAAAEPGDDRGAATEPGDDRGRHHGHDG